MSLFPSEDELPDVPVGPDSVSWSIASDVRLYAVMLYPLLLQVAHPTVGAGVRDYSDFEQRPWDRLLRSLDWVNLLVYGREEAVAAGRRLRAIHKGFKGTREDGTRYYALEPEAYAWVHATLLESYVAGHAHFGRPLTRSQLERFYAEYRALGRLAGVRERDLPDTWLGYREYFREVCEHELVRTGSVDRVLRSVTHPAAPPIPLPRWAWRVASIPPQRALWLGGVGLMAPRLRERLGIAWSDRDERAFQTFGRLSRGLEPVLPGRLKVMGPMNLRLRRRAIARGPLGPGTETGADGRAASAAVAA